MTPETKQHTMPFFTIGASSLFVVFLVLSLVSFAVLSITSAKNDYAFSEKLADRKTDYFTANNEAERILDAVDTCLASVWHGSDDTDAYLEAMPKALNELCAEQPLPLTLDFASEIPTVSYSVAVNEQQNLYVTLELCASPADTGGYYQIAQWQLAAAGPWQGDNLLNLLK